VTTNEKTPIEDTSINGSLFTSSRSRPDYHFDLRPPQYVGCNSWHQIDGAFSSSFLMLCGRKYLFLYCSIPHGIFDFFLGTLGRARIWGRVIGFFFIRASVTTESCHLSSESTKQNTKNILEQRQCRFGRKSKSTLKICSVTFAV
jgi:hypothetical protein